MYNGNGSESEEKSNEVFEEEKKDMGIDLFKNMVFTLIRKGRPESRGECNK